MHDTQFGSRYEHVLGALLSVGGKGLREELSKQMKLVQLLGGVAEKVRQASGSTRQVCTHEREHKCCFVFETNLSPYLSWPLYPPA